MSFCPFPSSIIAVGCGDYAYPTCPNLNTKTVGIYAVIDIYYQYLVDNMSTTQTTTLQSLFSNVFCVFSFL